MIQSATKLQQQQNRLLFGYVFLLSFPFPRYWAQVSFSPFQRRISLCLPPPKRYQMPLIITMFICAHSEPTKHCDKWALPCVSTCARGARLSIVIRRIHILPPAPSSPARLHGHTQREQQALCGKISSCPPGAERCNLLYWIRDIMRMLVNQKW